jgi:ATP-dependent helicase HrpA
MLLRAERADNDPKRYKEREDALAPYLQRLKTTPASELPPHFRWMVEEFKVSLFAQELGTAYPISSKRLDKALLN